MRQLRISFATPIGYCTCLHRPTSRLSLPAYDGQCSPHDRRVRHSFTAQSSHAFSDLNARIGKDYVFAGRRGMLKAGLSGLAGLTLANVLRARAKAAQGQGSAKNGKSVILLWMAGGPSHIDTWDMKPERPPENRGPFAPIATRLPGVRICEHLPKQAALLDQFTLIRSVDARKSNHEPNRVFQTANLDAEPRSAATATSIRRSPRSSPSIAAYNHPAMPPYVAFMKAASHIGWGGWLGKEFDPFLANDAAALPVYTDVGRDTGRVRGGDLFRLPRYLNADRIRSGGQPGASIRSSQSRSRCRRLDVWRWTPISSRRPTCCSVDGHKTHSICPASRTTSASVWQTPVVSAGAPGPSTGAGGRRLRDTRPELSRPSVLGTRTATTFPRMAGSSAGWGRFLPLFDHLLTTLVLDLKEQGLLDDVLVIAMGELGRTPSWEHKVAATDATTGPFACRCL